ncbi:hypothetical protein CRENBAI_023142 [Crenichthys baileyi]|uniref:Uncharacterized protein n=1 Tax=Crenichthys baileyi TaxID=28760 RepID=A0AAV9SN73_9TELE
MRGCCLGAQLMRCRRRLMIVVCEENWVAERRRGRKDGGEGQGVGSLCLGFMKTALQEEIPQFQVWMQFPRSSH